MLQQSSVPNTKNNDGAQYGRPGQLVPMTTYTFFKMIKYFAVFSKIEQNNAEITRSPDISGLALKPDQMQQLKRLISLAESNELNAFGSPDYKLLSQIAFQWPDKYRFPGKLFFISKPATILFKTFLKRDRPFTKHYFTDIISGTGRL